MTCDATVQDIRQDDVGTTFLVTVTDDCVALDVSTATLMQIKFRKPDGTVLTKTAVYDTTGTDGKIKYVTVTDDLDVVGKWKIQAYVEMGTGKWNSTTDEFNVIANL